MLKPVECWRSNLASSKANHKKLATTIASPSSNPELFEEGWKAALERDAGMKGAPSSGYDIVERAGLFRRFNYDCAISSLTVNRQKFFIRHQMTAKMLRVRLRKLRTRDTLAV